MPIAYNYYEKADSKVHNLNPRVKLIWLACVFILTMVFNHPLFQFVLFLVSLAAAIVARLSLKRIAKITSTIFYIGIIVAIMWALMLNEGVPLFNFIGFNVSTTSIYYGIALGFRVTTLLFTLLVVLMTTSQAELEVGLVKLGFPYSIAFVVILAFRFLPTLMGEGKTILEAQTSRGFQWDKNRLRGFLKKAKLLGVPLFSRSLNVVNNLSYAMESRAFGAYKNRTYYFNRTLTNTEKLIISIILITTVGFMAARIFFDIGAIIPELL
jgi:energy-coupling factor transport system permease protein